MIEMETYDKLLEEAEKNCFPDLDSTWNYFLIKIPERWLELEKAQVFQAYCLERNSRK